MTSFSSRRPPRHRRDVGLSDSTIMGSFTREPTRVASCATSDMERSAANSRSSRARRSEREAALREANQTGASVPRSRRRAGVGTRAFAPIMSRVFSRALEISAPLTIAANESNARLRDGREEHRPREAPSVPRRRERRVRLLVCAAFLHVGFCVWRLVLLVTRLFWVGGFTARAARRVGPVNGPAAQQCLETRSLGRYERDRDHDPTRC